MMKTMDYKKREITKKDKKKMISIIVLVVVVITCAFLLAYYFEHKDGAVSNDTNNDILDTKEKVVDGKTYKHKKNIHSYLFIGVDSKGEATGVDYYVGGGQGDVQMVLTFDDSKRTWQLLQINRDAMVEVDVLGVTGDVVGSVTQQICLAHSYGDGTEISCENTVNAVSRMLEYESIDGYFALNMDGIKVLNNAVGGVTVNVTSDFSKVDSTIEMGTITLTDDQAEAFVRDRKDVDDQTNGARMKRQLEFMSGLLDCVKGKDANFALEVYNKLSSYVITDMSEGDLSKLFTKFENYTQKDIVTIRGDLKIVDEHYAYYQSEISLNEAIVEMFYDIKE